MSIRRISESRVEAYADAVGADLFISSSRVSDFVDLLYVLEEGGVDGKVSVLTDGETAKQLRRRFLTSAHLVDHIEEGTLTVRQTDEYLPSYVVTEQTVTTITGLDDSILTTLTTDDEEFVTSTREELRQRYDDATELSFRTPAYSEMLGALGDELGSEMQADIEAVLSEAVATRNDRTTVDPVRLSILMGAKNEVQFYELGNWGESTGVGSKAKFSREKRKLEDVGLVDTEKIPKDIGRPRQRLVLGEEVDDTDPERLVSLTESVLSA